MAAPTSVEVALTSTNALTDDFPIRRFQVKRGLTAFDPKEEDEEHVEGFGIGRSSRRTKNPFYAASVDNAWFNSPVISRRHAVFNIDGSNPPQLTIMDVKATHGVFVNGIPLTPRQPKILGTGDRIQLGDFVQAHTDGRRETWEPHEFEVRYSETERTSHEASFQSSTARAFTAPTFDSEDETDYSDEANMSDGSNENSSVSHRSALFYDDEEDLDDFDDDEQYPNDDTHGTDDMLSETYSSPEPRIIEDSMPNEYYDEEADSEVELYQEKDSYLVHVQATKPPQPDSRPLSAAHHEAVESTDPSLSGQPAALAVSNKAVELTSAEGGAANAHATGASPRKMSLNSILDPVTQAPVAFDELPVHVPAACPSVVPRNHTFAFNVPTSNPPFPVSPNLYNAYEAPLSYSFSDQLAWQAEDHSHAYDQGPFQTAAPPSPPSGLLEPLIRKSGMSIGSILDEQEDQPKRSNKRKSSEMSTFEATTSSESSFNAAREDLETTPSAPKASALRLTPPSSPPSEPTILDVLEQEPGTSTLPQGSSAEQPPATKKLKVHFDPSVSTFEHNAAKAAAKKIATRKNTRNSRLQGIKSTAMTAALGMVAGGVAVFSALAFSPEEWFL